MATNQNISNSGSDDAKSFTLEKISALIESKEAFPVDFDDAWQWLGYSSKQKAREVLQKQFVVGVDYIKCAKSSTFGRPPQGIFLTKSCFEQFKIIATSRIRGSIEEHTIQKNLSFLLKGKTEVATPAGYIDILTSTEIIEVKSVRDWKGAIGQVLVYRNYYPSHSARIHLFGAAQSKFKEMVEQNCTKLGIQVTWGN